MADMMFVLNNSDVPIYLYQGALDTPSTTFYDLQLPAKSYTILNPHGGFQFSALLNNPTECECYVIFAYGYADEYRALKQYFGDWDWYLPPLTVPEFQWYFDWSFAPPIGTFCRYSDFTINRDNWAELFTTTYVPAVGFQLIGVASPTGGEIQRIVPYVELWTTLLVIIDASVIKSGLGVPSAEFAVHIYNAGVLVTAFANKPFGTGVTTYTFTGIPAQRTGDEIRLYLQCNNNSTTIQIHSASVTYTGSQYQPDNCP